MCFQHTSPPLLDSTRSAEMNLSEKLSLAIAFSSKRRRHCLSGQKEVEVRMGEFMALCYFGWDWDGGKERGMIKISCVETLGVIFITHLCEVQSRLAH